MGTELMKRHQNPSFFLRSQKEEFRGAIVEPLGPGVHYLLAYWACGPS